MRPSASTRQPVVTLLFAVALAGCSGAGDATPGPVVDGAAIGVEGAHEHGVVRMGLAVDGRRLSLDLEAPADAVFGFEHAPTSDEERMVVAEALSRVRVEIGGVINLPVELSCEVEQVDVPEAPDHDEHADEDGPDEDHAHDDEDHSDEGDNAHSEVRVAVSWMCAESPERNAATLSVNTLWPDAALVDLTVITSQGQAAGRVASDAAFRF